MRQRRHLKLNPGGKSTIELYTWAGIAPRQEPLDCGVVQNYRFGREAALRMESEGAYALAPASPRSLADGAMGAVWASDASCAAHHHPPVRAPVRLSSADTWHTASGDPQEGLSLRRSTPPLRPLH